MSAATVTLTRADAFFAARTRAAVWAAFDADMRGAAVTEALEMVSRFVGYDITITNTPDRFDYNAEYAVYWQALYLLTTSGAIADGDQSAPHFRAVEEQSEAGTPEAVGALTDLGALCPEAAAWLQTPPRRQLVLARG